MFLDEIGDVPGAIQVKLLRILQEREFERLGSNVTRRIDVRVIAATNQDLRAALEQGTFREDLYFRLNVVTLCIPPLRERPGDIAALAEHFGRKYAAVNGLPYHAITKEALLRLERHMWRGNVRELENTIHRAVLMADGDSITPDLIDAGPVAPANVPGGVAPSGIAALVGRRMEDVERDLILETLGHTLGNRTHAATILGISIRALRNKLRDYAAQGVNVPPPAAGVAA